MWGAAVINRCRRGTKLCGWCTRVPPRGGSRLSMVGPSPYKRYSFAELRAVMGPLWGALR